MQRENRRLAAIVAAGIAGYSRLVGQDEEGTLRALRAHRQELIDQSIGEHGGRYRAAASAWRRTTHRASVRRKPCRFDPETAGGGRS